MVCRCRSYETLLLEIAESVLAAMAEASQINAIKVAAGKKGGFKDVMTLSERRTLVEFF